MIPSTPTPLANGQAVREAINQGFTRAELASLADKDATRVYAGANTNGKVVKNKIVNAIDNYRAAVNCFVKALPSLPNDGSAELVRNEIRRLLERLGELQSMARKIPKNEDDEDDDADDDRLNHIDDNLRDIRNKLSADVTNLRNHTRFKVGDVVEIQDKNNNARWRRGVINNIDDKTSSSYHVTYSDDHSNENSVPEVRIRDPLSNNNNDEPTTTTTTALSSEIESAAMIVAEERRLIVSEIVESERVYRNALRDLTKYYLTPMSNPLRWGGERTKSETVFSQKIMTTTEIKTIFANIEEIAGLSEIFFDALEVRFNTWTVDQKLGDVFILYAPFFSCYATYADAIASSAAMLESIRGEREAFETVCAMALAKGVAPLEAIMRLPCTRVGEYKRLLERLCRRTPESHPDYDTIKDAYIAMGAVEEQISQTLNRKENQRRVLEIETKFKPPLALVTPSRLLIRHSANLKRIDQGSREPLNRLVWLFNDVILCGRPSEWFAQGFYRYDGQIRIRHARNAPEFGPTAFEIQGTADSGGGMITWVFLCPDEMEKKSWLNDLRGFVISGNKNNHRRSGGSSSGGGGGGRKSSNATSPTNQGTGGSSSSTLLGPVTRNVIGVHKSQQQQQQPDDSYWRELKDEQSGKNFYYCEKTKETSWEKPQWRKVMAEYDFDGSDANATDELKFRKGDVFLMEDVIGSEFGWARAKVPGTNKQGSVPKNRVKFI
jgi:hypothetical protein